MSFEYYLFGRQQLITLLLEIANDWVQKTTYKGNQKVGSPGVDAMTNPGKNVRKFTRACLLNPVHVHIHRYLIFAPKLVHCLDAKIISIRGKAVSHTPRFASNEWFLSIPLA